MLKNSQLPIGVQSFRQPSLQEEISFTGSISFYFSVSSDSSAHLNDTTRNLIKICRNCPYFHNFPSITSYFISYFLPSLLNHLTSCFLRHHSEQIYFCQQEYPIDLQLPTQLLIFEINVQKHVSVDRPSRNYMDPFWMHYTYTESDFSSRMI